MIKLMNGLGHQLVILNKDKRDHQDISQKKKRLMIKLSNNHYMQLKEKQIKNMMIAKN
jgi:hypothetical protein